ncbi:hypothetical protein J3998_04690 [Thiomicrorhabdus sp. 6S2-11]|uniref:Uncharacterized protein n=1 Tax=Thiomicrorhabdus marina TaxID=2818442 RepID=A0ABS3Q3F5_9GAMM|nr:hypothetical protein [Thiomicrorhabdus marina]MBO1926865.1 hypothetical protein [Thiomicrorhabdus marina]
MTDKFIKKPQFLAASLLILLSIGIAEGSFTFLQTIIGLMAWFMIWPMKDLPTSYYGQWFIAASFGAAALLVFGVFLNVLGLGLGAGIGYFIFWGLAAVTVYFLILNPRNIVEDV